MDKHFRLRLDEAMHEDIAASALGNGRSINAEIIARLSVPNAQLAALDYVATLVKQEEDRVAAHAAAHSPEAIRRAERNVLAANAMNGMLAAARPEDGSNWPDPVNIAANAYRYADAMLAAREPKP